MFAPLKSKSHLHKANLKNLMHLALDMRLTSKFISSGNNSNQFNTEF